MRRLLQTSDRAAGQVARAATTLGQCALVVLGVHLAADNLDDSVLSGVSSLVDLSDRHLSGPSDAVAGVLGQPAGSFAPWQAVPQAALSGWIAFVVEVLAAGLLCGSFLLTARQAQPSWTRWKRAASVRAVVVPAALAGVLLAGAWSLSMALEDLLPGGAGPAWLPRTAAALVALAAIGRFGLPAWRRAVAALEPPRRWTAGWGTALVLVPVGALAWVHGVPLWGPLRSLLGGS